MFEDFETVRVPAREARIVAIFKGDTIDVVNTYGGQVVDTWAFPQDNPEEYLSMEHSRILHYRMTFRPGDALCTDSWRTVLTFVEDTSPGLHDTLCPACCAPSYRIFYGYNGYHDNCADNLRAAFDRIGRTPPRIPTPWNLFMETVVKENDRLEDNPSRTGPGQYVRLRAEMDCFFAVSACPQDLIVINGTDGVPRSVELRIRRASDQARAAD